MSALLKYRTTKHTQPAHCKLSNSFTPEFTHNQAVTLHTAHKEAISKQLMISRQPRALQFYAITADLQANTGTKKFGHLVSGPVAQGLYLPTHSRTHMADISSRTESLVPTKGIAVDSLRHTMAVYRTNNATHGLKLRVGVAC